MICVTCPSGVFCSGSGEPQALAGTWLDTSSAARGLSCSKSRCVASGQCAANRINPPDANPLCGHCEEGFSEWYEECLECGDGVRWDLVIIMVALASTFVIGWHTALVKARNPSPSVMFYWMQITAVMLDVNLAPTLAAMFSWANVDFVRATTLLNPTPDSAACLWPSTQV